MHVKNVCGETLFPVLSGLRNFHRCSFYLILLYYCDFVSKIYLRELFIGGGGGGGGPLDLGEGHVLID